MRPKFRVGQRVRVTQASADWDAPVGALGVVASYDGANDRGTDWAVGFLQDGSEAYDPCWPVDESYLEAHGPGGFDPLPFEGHCLAPDGAWMDEVITNLTIGDPPDREWRLRQAIEVMQPVLAGSPLATQHSWHPRTDGTGDILVFLTTWCGCAPWAGIVASLRARVPHSSYIVDDGWSVEFALQHEGAQALCGPDALGFRLFVDPWSSFERRPRGARYPPSPAPPLT